MPRAKGARSPAGRKPRWGERSAVSIRFPVEHRSHYEAEAAARGISLNEYVIRLLAVWHGLAEPSALTDAGEGSQLRLGA